MISVRKDSCNHISHESPHARTAFAAGNRYLPRFLLRSSKNPGLVQTTRSQ
jgi:hypothetical protein